ncbi:MULTISPECIES: trypsin-like peptidase domain-containing protein [unclassified Mycobacterium]|uniref:trypsin-like peptidase domain-containing protein n=1 Tax=unclassified Mycobacterium TaxID=2642494 RepID=UPI0006DCA694|nr:MULTISPECIES: trypsin-like peptidase domain-containing protein [unclassified Mycobacterium]
MTRPTAARRLLALAATALTLWAGAPGMAAADSGRPQAKPEERAAALIRPSIMYLAGEGYGLVRLPSGEVLSQFGRGSSMPFLATWNCTAFVVNPDGWVATAGHCVDPASATELILKRAATEYRSEFPDAPESSDPATTLDWLGKNARVEGDSPGQGPHVSVALMSGTGTKLADKMVANIVDFRPLGKGDAALLKVAKRNLPSSELATDAEVTIGTPVLTVGYPESTQNVTGPSLDPTYKSGKVSKKSIAGSNPAYEIDAAMTEGMSGGPAIGLNGKVVGLNSFAPAGESQPFNFIAPADGVAAILAAKGVKPMLGPADRFYRKGLADFYAGHYTDAIGEFDQTLAMSPGYPGLDDLKTTAVNLRQQYGDASSLSGKNLLAYIVISVASVIALGAGLTFLGLRLRRTRGPAPEVAPLRLMPRESGADEPHFCAHCGAEHHPSERFCPNCGKRIEVPAAARGTGLIS